MFLIEMCLDFGRSATLKMLKGERKVRLPNWVMVLQGIVGVTCQTRAGRS